MTSNIRLISYDPTTELRVSRLSRVAYRDYFSQTSLFLSLFLISFSIRIARDVGESLQCRSIDLLFCNKRLSSVTPRCQAFTFFIRYFGCVSYCADVCNENSSVSFDKKNRNFVSRKIRRKRNRRCLQIHK